MLPTTGVETARSLLQSLQNSPMISSSTNALSVVAESTQAQLKTAPRQSDSSASTRQIEGDSRILSSRSANPSYV